MNAYEQALAEALKTVAKYEESSSCRLRPRPPAITMLSPAATNTKDIIEVIRGNIKRIQRHIRRVWQTLKP